MRLTLKLAVVLAAAGLWVERAAATSAGTYRPPSAGNEKIYLLDDQPFTPIEILPKAQGIPNQKRNKQTYLRDPGQSLAPQKATPHRSVTEKAKPVQSARPARKFVSKPLKFQRITVKGHSRDPRVEFSDDPLDLKRSDEPLSRDFLSRTYMEERGL